MIPEKDAWGVDTVIKHPHKHKPWSKKWLTLPLLVIALCYTSRPTWLPKGCDHTLDTQSNQPNAFSSNGRTGLVQWDGKSLVVKGQRIFLWSGEFHTFRLPSPELWGDILEKTKAAGFNAISVYVHWGLVNPAPGKLDFSGFRALDPLFKLAMKSGLWVVLRPGVQLQLVTNPPFSGGGIPHWVTSEVAGHLRTNNTNYARAWEPYVDAIADILVKGNWQIGDTTGGPVIAVQLENEYLATHSPGHKYKAPYMAALARRFVDRGIVVPLTYNDAYMGGNYATGEIGQCEEGEEEGGENGSHGKGRCGVELYGVDSYPQRFDCSNPDVWNPVVTTYHDFHMKTNPHEPLYIPEFQGGSFDAWGGGTKHGWAGAGYEACRQLTGPEFSQVFNLGLWANNAKMINLYMLYGGTTWGYMPFPGVYTSYDYGAGITETRRLTSKYAELKRQGLFLRSVPDFYATDVVGNSTDSDHHPIVNLDNPKVFGTLLRNEATGAEFYIVRHADSTSHETVGFRLNLAGTLAPNSVESIPLTIPSITLSGRASKVLLRNVSYGSSRLAWSTASILYAGKMGNRDVLFLHGPSSEGHEFAVPLQKQSSGSARISQHVSVSQHTLSNSREFSVVTVLPGSVGLVTIFETSSQLVLFADSDTAGNFWAPVLAPQGKDSLMEPNPYANFFQFGTNSSVLVGGPYLVRDAQLSSKGELSLRGDLEKESMLTVIAELGAVRRVFWNGVPVDTMLHDSSASTSGVLRFLVFPRLRVADIEVPKLTDWRYQDSLPEVQEGYDDSKWMVANKTSTNIPERPYFGENVLYGCDYGFCEGAVVWRGHFTGSSETTGARLVINGGLVFAASIWLNGEFLATTYGNSSNYHNNIPETDQVYHFPANSVIQGGNNVLTVVQDNMGLEMTVDWTADFSKSPRGIRGYELIGGSFTEWKVQGKEGGYTGYKDKLRGVQNEGGLYGERQGWHLPGFDDSNWTKSDISNGLPNNQAGVGWFRTTFSLKIPHAYDVPISFEFENKPEPYRALLFVNGWLMGRYIANLGPQYKFPIPEGILNHRGENTVAIAIWSMENAQLSPNLKLTIEGIFDSGYDFSSPL
ncbi:unnamed protein product [Rhizoctonia solani]|nr:unnamed protein product [Rhizoctonia solani]